MDTGTYQSVTRSIKVVVRPFYLDDQSAPDENHFVWAYHVEIVNDGLERVQLRTRHWRITDAAGRVQEVRGPGVVGVGVRPHQAEKSEADYAAHEKFAYSRPL